MTSPNSFVNHPAFDTFKPYMYLSPSGSSWRIQLRRRRMPAPLKREAAKVSMSCVSCGKTMHPLRGDGRYFAAACPLQTNISCSRTANASLEYHTVYKALNEWSRNDD